MRSLIVCYSHSGNNALLAEVLRDKMGCPLHRIVEKRRRRTISILADALTKRDSALESSDIQVGDYDQVVFVAPVWGGKVASPMRTFIECEKGNLQRYHFITICNGEEGQEAKVEQELHAVSGIRPKAIKELWINTLLPEERRNNVRHTFGYRVDREDLEKFEREIGSFLQQMEGSEDETGSDDI